MKSGSSSSSSSRRRSKAKKSTPRNAAAPRVPTSGDAEYRTVAGVSVERLVELREIAVSSLLPMRESSVYEGQRHMPGWWWSSTNDDLLQYESIVEQVTAMTLDWERAVVAIAAQPLKIYFNSLNYHVPDYLVEFDDGTRRLVDVTTEWRLANKPEVGRSFALTRQICTRLGWPYVVVKDTDFDPQFVVNLRLISTFRRRTPPVEKYGPALVAGCTTPTPLAELVASVGPRDEAWPVALHLIWRHVLEINLYEPVTETSLIARSLEELPPSRRHVVAAGPTLREWRAADNGASVDPEAVDDAARAVA